MTVALWAGGISGLLVIVAGASIAWVNRASETVVLGFAALFGALVLFGVQLVFQLRGSTVEEPVGTQVIVNKTAPTATALQPANLVRADGERVAAEWLAAKTPGAFDESGKLARDLLVFSILNYFATDEQDWRTKKRSYRFPAFGSGSSMTEFQRQEDQNAHSLSEAEIRSALRVGRNLFAEAPLLLPSVGLRLPPGSQLIVSEAAAPAMRTTLTIRNPVTHIDFVITPTLVSGGLHPPTSGQKGFAIGQTALAGLPDAEYWLYPIRIMVRASFARTRAHHPDVELHRAWIERIQQGLGNWFRSA